METNKVYIEKEEVLSAVRKCGQYIDSLIAYDRLNLDEYGIMKVIHGNLNNLPNADVVDANKYRKAILVLQAIAQHRGSDKGYHGEYVNEWTQASGYRDCQEAAERCLKALGEPVVMPNKIKR